MNNFAISILAPILFIVSAFIWSYILAIPQVRKYQLLGILSFNLLWMAGLLLIKIK